MSAPAVALAEKAVQLAELELFYARLMVDYAGTSPVARRAAALKVTYEAAAAARRSAREAIDAHEALVRAERTLRDTP